jgi:hypothetical protein
MMTKIDKHAVRSEKCGTGLHIVEAPFSGKKAVKYWMVVLQTCTTASVLFLWVIP